MTPQQLDEWIAERGEDIEEIRADAAAAVRASEILRIRAKAAGGEISEIEDQRLPFGAWAATFADPAQFMGVASMRAAKAILDVYAGKGKYGIADSMTFVLGEDKIAVLKTALAPEYRFERPTFRQVRLVIANGFTPWA